MTPLSEEVRVGIFSYQTQRWSKKIIKRKVFEKELYSRYPIPVWKGQITYQKRSVNVYTRDDQRYWTMFLDEVM